MGPDETLGENATTGAELRFADDFEVEAGVEAEAAAVRFWRLGMRKLGTDRRDWCDRCNKEERLGVRESRVSGTGVSPVVVALVPVGPVHGP